MLPAVKPPITDCPLGGLYVNVSPLLRVSKTALDRPIVFLKVSILIVASTSAPEPTACPGYGIPVDVSMSGAELYPEPASVSTI